jgi:hypothetical protein
MDIENELPTAPVPKPRKKPKRAKRVRAAVAKPKADEAKSQDGELEGLTRTDCPFDCNEANCVITRIGFCGHPLKGGLQSALLSKPDVVRTYSKARRMLAHMKIESRE